MTAWSYLEFSFSFRHNAKFLSSKFFIDEHGLTIYRLNVHFEEFKMLITSRCEENLTFRWGCSNFIKNFHNGPLTRYVKLRIAHAPEMPGTFFLPPRISAPDLRDDMCVMHVPWCMPGSLTSSCLWSWWRGKRFVAFQAHAQTAILRIW